MTIKFLHISDLHVSADNAFNAVVEQKIAFIKANYPDHHYIITGDLIDNEGKIRPGTQVPVNKDDPEFWKSAFAAPPPPLGPLDPHLEIARQGMRNAHALISQLPLPRVFLCSGNHDFGLWGNVYHEEFVKAFDEILWQPVNGGKLVTQLGVLDNPLRLPYAGARTPVMFTVAEAGTGTTAQLIFLNTAVDPSSVSFTFPPPLASGLVSGEQLNKFQTFVQAELLSPIDPTPIRKSLGIVRLVALHHHPWFVSESSKLRDADSLLGLVRRTTDLILFGHKHVQKRYEANTAEAAQIQYGGLSSGWIRSETTAAEIVINNANSVQLSYVPII